MGPGVASSGRLLEGESLNDEATRCLLAKSRLPFDPRQLYVYDPDDDRNSRPECDT